MSSSALILSVSETMATLMRSMGRFVHKRIENSKNKAAYRFAMEACIRHVSSELQNMDMIKAKISSVREEAREKYPARFFNKRQDERKHHIMAVQHALDIVNSLEARFITGASDDTPRGYKGKGSIYESDDEIF